MLFLGTNSAFLKDDIFIRKTVTVRDADVWMHCQFENAVTFNWIKGIDAGDYVINSTR